MFFCAVVDFCAVIDFCAAVFCCCYFLCGCHFLKLLFFVNVVFLFFVLLFFCAVVAFSVCRHCVLLLLLIAILQLFVVPSVQGLATNALSQCAYFVLI